VVSEHRSAGSTISKHEYIDIRRGGLDRTSCCLKSLGDQDDLHMDRSGRNPDRGPPHPGVVIKRPGRINRKYSKPAKVPKGATVEEVPCWHNRGRYAKDNVPVCDGKWVDAINLRADGGWLEIQAKLEELCPDGRGKYEAWNKAGAPEASSFFPPIAEKEAA
jgi:hypothetical protein